MAPLFFLLVLYLPTAWFGVAMTVPITLAAWEWGRLSFTNPPHHNSVLALSVVVAVIALAVSFYSRIWLPLSLFGVVLWIILSLGLWRESVISDQPSGLSWCKIPLVLLSAFAAILWIHQESPLLILLMFVLVWAMDTGAYFTGRRFGRHKLAPLFSPGKTVEGLAGGIVLVILVATLVSPWLSLNSVWLWFYWVMLALLVGVISVVGDLLESREKRIAKVKDSGSLLPGHGGVLDRIDSILAAAPVFAAGWVVLGRFSV